MTQILPVGNDLSLDDNGYTANGVGSYANNYTAISDPTQNGNHSPHVTMQSLQAEASFLMGAVLTSAPLTFLSHIVTAASISSNLDAWLAPSVKDITVGVRLTNAWFKVPRGGSFYQITYNWMVNPFRQRPWTPDDITGGRYRFGFVRLPFAGNVQVSRVYLESNY